MFRIINTDNYGGDYPNEKFVENLPRLSKEHATAIAWAINAPLGSMQDRFWKVVPEDYKLQPGFEP